MASSSSLRKEYYSLELSFLLFLFCYMVKQDEYHGENENKWPNVDKEFAANQ